MSIHSASTDPDIGLAEAIDQNGRARYEAVSAGVVNDDSAIAPWIDIPVGLSDIELWSLTHRLLIFFNSLRFPQNLSTGSLILLVPLDFRPRLLLCLSLRYKGAQSVFCVVLNPPLNLRVIRAYLRANGARRTMVNHRRDGETVTRLQILQSSGFPKFRCFLNCDLVRVSLIYDKNLMNRTWYHRHIVPFCPPSRHSLRKSSQR